MFVTCRGCRREDIPYRMGDIIQGRRHGGECPSDSYAILHDQCAGSKEIHLGCQACGYAQIGYRTLCMGPARWTCDLDARHQMVTGAR